MLAGRAAPGGAALRGEVPGAAQPDHLRGRAGASLLLPRRDAGLAQGRRSPAVRPREPWSTRTELHRAALGVRTGRAALQPGELVAQQPAPERARAPGDVPDVRALVLRSRAVPP